MASDATRIPAVIYPAVGTLPAVVRQREIVPVAHERFTEEQMSKPVHAASAVTRLSKTVAEVTRSHRANPLGRPHVFVDLVCGTAGAKVHIEHHFGRRVFWQIVDWCSRPAPAAVTTLSWDLVSDMNDGTTAKTDANNLYLKSNVAGLATIAIF